MDFNLAAAGALPWLEGCIGVSAAEGMMKKAMWIGLGVVLAAAGGGAYLFLGRRGEQIRWRTAQVDQGAITQRVTASGTVNALVQCRWAPRSPGGGGSPGRFQQPGAQGPGDRPDRPHPLDHQPQGRRGRPALGRGDPGQRPARPPAQPGPLGGPADLPERPGHGGPQPEGDDRQPGQGPGRAGDGEDQPRLLHHQGAGGRGWWWPGWWTWARPWPPASPPPACSPSPRTCRG